MVLLSTVNLGASLLYKVPSGSGPAQVTYDDIAQQMYAVGPLPLRHSNIILDPLLCPPAAISNSCALTPATRAGLQCEIAIGIDGQLRQSLTAPVLFSAAHHLPQMSVHHEDGTCVTSTSSPLYSDPQRQVAFAASTRRRKLLHRPKPLVGILTHVIPAIFAGLSIHDHLLKLSATHVRVACGIYIPGASLFVCPSLIGENETKNHYVQVLARNSNLERVAAGYRASCPLTDRSFVPDSYHSLTPATDFGRLQEIALLIRASAGGPPPRAAIDLTDPALIKSALAAASSSIRDAHGVNAANAVSNSTLNTAAVGISNINTLAASTSSAIVSLHAVNPSSPLLLPYLVQATIWNRHCFLQWPGAAQAWHFARLFLQLHLPS